MKKSMIKKIYIHYTDIYNIIILLPFSHFSLTYYTPEGTKSSKTKGGITMLRKLLEAVKMLLETIVRTFSKRAYG